MTYTPNTPQGNQTVAATQSPILNNFTFLDNAINQEHNFDVSDATKTYHKQASMPNRAHPVALPAGTNGMHYVNGGQARYYDGTNYSQLTGALASANGYQWIGSVLLQWGFVNGNLSSLGTGQVTFPVAFPTAPFSIQTTPYFNTASSTNSAGTVFVRNTVSSPSSPLPATFNWLYNGSGGATGFYWMAIGN